MASTSADVIRCAIYLRISQDREMDGLAIDRQREDCERIARENGWRIFDRYIDQSKSATDKTRNRPEYDRMVTDYEAGEFTAIICWDLDRLTRQPRQLEDWIDRTEDRGLKLVTASGEVDLEDDNGRLFARMKASVARAEVERKSSRQSRAQIQRAKQGRPPKGIRPLGYALTGEIVQPEAEAVKAIYTTFVQPKGTLTAIARALSGKSTQKDLSEIPGIAAIPRLPRFTATLQQERNAKRIAEGLKPKKLPVDPDADWPPSTIIEILRNPRYVGYAVYTPSKARRAAVAVNAERRVAATALTAEARAAADRAELEALRAGKSSDEAKRLADAAAEQASQNSVTDEALTARRRAWREYIVTDEHGKPVMGQWNPIVDEDLWHEAQAKLDDPGRITNTVGTERRHLGSGLYRCGVCEKPVRGTSRGYKCRTTGHVNRTGKAIDDFVIAVVAGRLAEPDALRTVPFAESPHAGAISLDIDRLRARLERAQRDYDAELIEAVDLKRIRERTTAEIDALEVQRLSHARTRSTPTMPLLGTNDPAGTFRDADLEGQRRIVGALAEVTIHPATRGRKGFDPSTVTITWKAGTPTA
ncbi:recombinase family protein [Gordonia sp. 1D]|uniref:recombinase family protein n=1 Tax=Gordonia sp. 1D TaxID=1737359 RepID=UPI000BB8D19F|nr:recombinase family protein [Gordonia sp. 1D]ATD71736.1 integrase [Gordonia sp. 1D]